MNDLEYVLKMLESANKAKVAAAVGLSARTVCNVASGKQKSPSFETVRKLAEYFRGKASQ